MSHPNSCRAGGEKWVLVWAYWSCLTRKKCQPWSGINRSFHLRCQKDCHVNSSRERAMPFILHLNICKFKATYWQSGSWAIVIKMAPDGHIFKRVKLVLKRLSNNHIMKAHNHVRLPPVLLSSQFLLFYLETADWDEERWQISLIFSPRHWWASSADFCSTSFYY